MKPVAAILQNILRHEVDVIHDGEERIRAMREREHERAVERAVLRSAPTRHPGVAQAAMRRLRLIK